MALRTRYSLRELELESLADVRIDFLKAFKLIKQLPSTNPNSYWSIASYHGMPFKARRVDDSNAPEDQLYWNGYCQHGNVLFPTWHRFYCIRLEQALQAVLPESDLVALHYWDTAAIENLQEVPPLLSAKNVLIDGEICDNPLLNFAIQREIGLENNGTEYYFKPSDYTTVRYPYSGIQNPPDQKAIADDHNAQFTEETAAQYFQENMTAWLLKGAQPDDGDDTNNVRNEYKDCLEITEFRTFSNNSSATDGNLTLTSLEQPHNDIHLAVGGFTMPPPDGDYAGIIQGANGDMGENQTASFDPVFFLHHCNIDRMFWVWQKKHNCTDNLEITGSDSGTSSSGDSHYSQGPTPNQTLNQQLTMNTILYPYQDELGVPQTSTACVNIETQLGYTYSIGSMDQESWPMKIYKPEQVFQHTVKTWDEFKAMINDAVRRRKQRRSVGLIRFFVDRTYMRDEEPQRAGVPIFPAGGGIPGTFDFDGKSWMPTNYVKVDNLDREAFPSSFVVRAYYRKNGKMLFIGQRGVLGRTDRKSCANCQRHRYTGVSFKVNGIVNESADLDNVVVYLVTKDPSTGTEKIYNLRHKIDFVESQPRTRFITDLKQVE